MEERKSLTRREWEVLELVAEGKSNREVAELLCISVNTVEQHLKHIFGKLEVRNRTQAGWNYHQFRDTKKDNGNP